METNNKSKKATSHNNDDSLTPSDTSDVDNLSLLRHTSLGIPLLKPDQRQISLPAGAIGGDVAVFPKASVDQIKSENNKLRRKVNYMENLGVIVTDVKQENQKLFEDNLKLQSQIKEMQKLLQQTSGNFGSEDLRTKPEENRTPTATDDVTNSTQPTTNEGTDDNQSTSSCWSHVSTSQSEVTTMSEVSTNAESKDAIVPSHNDVTNETQEDPESRLGGEESRLLTSLMNDVSGGNHDDGNNPESNESKTSSASNEEVRLLNYQIRQVEEMVGIRSNSTGNDSYVISGDTSVTSQFTKLAAVFGRLAQRVVTSQKKVRTSKAFCNALMVDNDKTKARLKELEEKTAKLEKENAQLKSAARRSPVQAVDSPQSAGESSYEMDRNLKAKLQARILKLEAQRTEILRVNKQWDSQYRRLKQEHDKSISDVSNDVTRTQQKETKRRKDMELLLSAAKREIQNATQEKSVLTRRCATTHAQSVALKLEVTKLKENNRKLETDNSCLEAENARLGQALEAAYSIRQRMSESIPPDALPTSSGMINNNNNFALPTSDPTSPGFNSNEHPPINSNNSEGREDITLEELKTRVEVLQQQVKIYREDFETERRDREKSQGEKQSLDELLTQARHQLHALTQQVRTNEQDFKQERREKERLQRQLQWQTVSRDQNRYLGEPIATTTRGANDPPAYFHRDNDYVANNTRGSRRRQRGTPPQYPGPSDITGENLLSYPPSDPHY
uniref:TNFAIP3-interacting protein 1 isoform X1 n=1 Tax=Ciona intestinalis TaxID=7719 RepID=UPI0005213FDF|nr:TNFAIP3-interacting protein 1 isoform X1 [Ciona intestinalis]|eukprot:XP_009860879.1 TNFAIP3-interacting protein 1 isoform X1 [Ciona intestinalis]